MKDDMYQILLKTNPWWEKSTFRHKVIYRQKYLEKFEMAQHQVEVILGARRVGKTSVMHALINNLLSTGVDPKKILFLTADNPFLANTKLEDLVNDYMQYQNISMGDELYIFVDEIQDIANWQIIVKYYFDNSNIKFVVSGSSSLLINQEAKKLTGRTSLHIVWTLTWDEVGLFNSRYSFEQFIDYGGYPEIVLGVSNPQTKIFEIIESTVYRDLLSLYGIQNPKKLIDLLRILSEKIGTAVSYRSIARQLDIDDSTAKKLIEYLVSIRLIFAMPLFTTSAKKTLRNPLKYYFLDNGIIGCFALHSAVGIQAENLVAIHLVQTYSRSAINYGYLIEGGQEIDFGFGKDRFEVKYRDDWRDFLDKYDVQDAQIQPKLTMIVPKDTSMEYPNITLIGLERFLSM